jgi:outer membrane lipoprotein-sorting protein
MRVKILTFFFLIFTFLNGGDIKIPISFKANFTQSVKNHKGKTIRYRGRVFFNYPDTTKWIYNYPTKKEVCSSDGKLIIIDHDLEQVSYYSLDRGINLAKVLSKAKKYKGNLYVTTYKGKYYTIQLNNKGEIQQIAFKDNLDNQVNIIFRSIKYSNKPISRKKFYCAKPSGYDSIY